MTTDRGDLKVGYGALDSMAAGILGAAGAVDQKLNDMETRMDARRLEWEGDDSSAYEAARAGWDRAMSEMIAVLHDVATAVTRSRDEYQAAEAANARRFTWT